MGKKIFGFIIAIIVILGIFVGKAPETNLLKAVLPQNESVLIKAADKFSSNINVIFEADDSFDAEILKDDFLADFGQENINQKDFEPLFKDYGSVHRNLLSPKTKKLLQNKDYGTVFNNSKTFLYNPSSIIASDPKDDPFMLFSDFITNLSQKEIRYKSELNNKGYSVLTLNSVKNKAAVKKLFDLQKKYSIDGKNVYLAGSQVHSFFTAEKSAFEINIIAAFSMLFVLGLTYFYFRTLKVLIPIILSISAGIGIGYCASALIFRNVHVLTFVFSTTLIGICVDYSLHYFVEQDKEKLFKSLTNSLVTTVCAFLILLFSNIPLLKQIAVFTSVGLISVYFIVMLFYPHLSIDMPNRISFPKLKIKYSKIVASVFVLFILIGLFRLKFTDDITTLYKPSPKLAMSEKLLHNLSIDKTKTILAVSGKDIQTILEREEAAKDLISNNEISLSDFIPSVKSQKENFYLSSDLYNHKLYDCSNILSEKQIMSLLSQNEISYIYPDFDKYPFLKDFMIDENTSVIAVNGDISQNFKSKGVQVINVAKDISSQLADHRRTCLVLVISAFFVLLGYLYLNYKKLAIKIVLPSLCGILTSLAALGVVSQPVNLFHIFAMFLILGFTLDYSIFRVSKIENSADAVLISCLTTAFSFLLLTFTTFKLISSLGFVLSIGIFTSYIFSILLIKEGD